MKKKHKYILCVHVVVVLTLSQLQIIRKSDMNNMGDAVFKEQIVYVFWKYY